MNYEKHYKLLIERAKTRNIDGYVEIHHIIPRCLGGSNKKTNLVALTPEEHYVAHQLLVKMEPNNHKLIHAALMMCCNNNFLKRNNKFYGWLKRRYSEISKNRKGHKNGSFGRKWYYDPITLLNGKFLKDEIPSGWILGRNPKSVGKCKICEKETHHVDVEYCRSHSNYEKTKKLAENLYTDFISSECKSVCEFARLINSSQPRLSKLWNKWIPEYKKISSQGKSFKGL